MIGWRRQENKFMFKYMNNFIHIILGLKEVYQDYIQDEKIKSTANKITNILGVTIPAIIIFILFNLNV